MVGNTVVARHGDVYGYAADFNELEVLGFVDVKVNDKVSLRLTGDYVNNSGADSLNTAYLFGGSLSYGKDKGSVKLSANYRKIEADAVIGAFTYSDLMGRRHERQGARARILRTVSRRERASTSTYLLNTKGVKEGEEGSRLQEAQVDFQVKF